ncbi:NAD-dependent epimerase/dehydratase [Trypanosoma melophagium]|uniref:NAD-dependent epimerase/dehydratase n=1 Tax=Trypanosoma melophagium TaxID=715481 RepID=UPI00351A7FE7|nr:NAD-dependent epimerase/dehydratase [Trypanosoma melophagium]
MVGHKKLLLLGGTGFVGSHILYNALQSGWRVVCATRGGVPKPGVPLLDAALQQYYYGTQQHTSPHNINNTSSNNNNNSEEGLQCCTPPLEFVSLDACSRSQVFALFADHPDTTAVVSCVGARTHNHVEARRVCGDANVNIAAAIYTRGAAVRRVVLISAEPLRRSQQQQQQQTQKHNGLFFTTPTLPLALSPQWRLWRGYFHGKRLAERAVLENFPDRAVVLRPGLVVYGDGPLALIARPLECALRPLHSACGVCTPPMHVKVLAGAVMRAIEDGHTTPGVWDYDRMHQVCAQETQADA